MTAPTDARQRIFLSYRREDCGLHARLLAEYLRDKANADVFRDLDSIELGSNFKQTIEDEIAKCDAVIVMVGDDWLEVSRDGQRRIDDERDFVRLEVRSALQRNVPVIPVLVEGATMPQPSDMPEDISELAYRNGTELSDEAWDHDIERLASSLPAPTSSASEQGAPKARKERASIDFVAARAFIESIPEGRWTSYKDVSAAGGSPTGAMAVGQWLMARGEEIPNFWRVLTSSGEVGGGYAPSDPALPQTPEAVLSKLKSEGVAIDDTGRASANFRWTTEEAGEEGVALAEERSPSAPARAADTLIVAGRRAYPDYLLASAYICQAGRSFRSGVERLGFYSDRQIRPEIPLILHRRDHVLFSPSEVARLREKGRPYDTEVADLVEKALNPNLPWAGKRGEDESYQVFLLTPSDGTETVRLDAPVRHGGKGAWTQSQRYASLAALRDAYTTDDL